MQFRLSRSFLAPSILALAALLTLAGCGKHETAVEIGDREQILHWGNLSEPTDLDPQITTSIQDANVSLQLFEGLTTYDPKDLHPIPGVAERWESTPDAQIWTFHLRKNAKWSNGDPVTAKDFVFAYQRILSPKLGAEYANMVTHLKNGAEYLSGKLTDFSQVGVKAADDYTLVLTLWHPLPYLPHLVSHQAWFPLHRATIEKFGKIDDRGTAWTKPGNHVGNGPFVLSEWKPNQVIVLKKSPTYWDRDVVKLSEVHVYPIENETTEEAAFRAGQLHFTAQTPIEKIADYKKDPHGYLRQTTALSTYFYRLNVRKPPLDDVRVRRALALAIDQVQIVEKVSKGDQEPAYNFVPPNTAGYTGPEGNKTNIPAAQKLLADAGYPGGKGFPKLELLFNTTEGHRKIAEAIQQMWRRNLGIDISLYNQEAKVWQDTMREGNYQISRYAWGGDYLDPSTFLDIMTTGNGNNQTGWSNAEYDRLINEARMTADNSKRYEIFKRCEQILAEDAPLAFVYFYKRNILIRPEVKGYYGNLLDLHTLKGVYLDASAAK